MTTVGIYASSDMQSEASIEDQIRICKELAAKEGWQIAQTYADYEISGAFIINRPGAQKLLSDVREGKIDIVLAEALDRFSRDQEDIAVIFKRVQFSGAKMMTLAEGEISALHIGLKGTMNALFLKDLAAKTHRGLRGRVEAGKSGGGLTYGYDVIKRIDPVTNEFVRGDRSVNEAEAEIVRRIFREYIAGTSPRSIAHTLNAEGVAGPQGGQWGPSTIYGNRERGTGILNNELYIGKLIWNRLRYIKDPETGKRVSKPNPPDALIVKDVPAMRIVDDELWNATKKLQGEINRKDTPLWKKNRPKTIFSQLMKCGCCGGGYTMISKKHLGCATNRNKGTCDNRLTMPRENLERMVLSALRDHLMDERLCEEFCKEYARRMNELHMRHNASIAGYRAELAKLERETDQMIRSITEGMSGTLFAKRSHIVQARKEELEALLASKKEEKVLFHPGMANRYQKEIRNLLGSLNSESNRAEAITILRSLIDRIVLTPTPSADRLVVDLIGDLAGILSIATSQDRTAVTGDLSKLQPVDHLESFDELAEMEKAAKDGGPILSEVIVDMHPGR